MRRYPLHICADVCRVSGSPMYSTHSIIHIFSHPIHQCAQWNLTPLGKLNVTDLQQVRVGCENLHVIPCSRIHQTAWHPIHICAGEIDARWQAERHRYSASDEKEVGQSSWEPQFEGTSAAARSWWHGLCQQRNGSASPAKTRCVYYAPAAARGE